MEKSSKELVGATEKDIAVIHKGWTCHDNVGWKYEIDAAWTPERATTEWYDTVKTYDWDKPEENGFSNMVWTARRMMGCGVAGEVLVCRYCSV